MEEKTAEWVGDVVVVGAGICGLYVARKLEEQGRKVIVLEAQNRLGGRIQTERTCQGHPADLGAMWVGARHERLKALLKDLQVPTYTQYDTGKRVLDYGGDEASTYTGTIPNMSIASLVELQVTIWRVDFMARAVPLRCPGKAPKAALWDSMTVGGWIKRNICTRGARDTMQVVCRSVWGAEPDHMSLLYFLHYVHASGGLEQLVEGVGAAQDARIAGGTAAVLHKLATPLKHGVRLRSVVREVHQYKDAVRVVAEHNGDDIVLAGHRQHFVAQRVVMALAPSLLPRISFLPGLPTTRVALCRRLYSGGMSKFFVSYESAFWRDQGFAGEAINTNPSLELPVVACLDACTPELSHHAYSTHFPDTGDVTAPSGPGYALVAFVSGTWAEQFAGLTEKQRKTAVLRSLERWFGPQALQPVDFLEKVWSKCPYARGCPVDLYPAGSFAHYGRQLRIPWGRVHFASTDTAVEWTGYMEGSLEAADRVLQELTAGDAESDPPTTGLVPDFKGLSPGAKPVEEVPDSAVFPSSSLVFGSVSGPCGWFNIIAIAFALLAIWVAMR